MGQYFQMCVLFQAMTVLYSASISQLLRRPPNPKILEDSIKLFNEQLNNSSSLYKLLEVGSHGKVDPHGNHSLTFVIKETACLKSADPPSECPFKEGGVMKNCTMVYCESRQDKAELSCQTLDQPVSSLPPVASEEELLRSHHKAKFIISSKKKETTFLDVRNKEPMGSHLSASCLLCMFDDLPVPRNANN